MARVLIVDDERLIHDLIKGMLRDLGHVLAGEAFSGPESVEKVRDQKPDIVLMDINMSGAYDGLKAGRIIQEESNIPVVYISADSPDTAIKKVIQSGAYGFIVKPFNKNQLETILQIALSRGNAEQRLKKIIKKNQDEMEKEIAIRYMMNKINHVLDPYDHLKELLEFVGSTVKLDGTVLYRFHEPDNERPYVEKILDTSHSAGKLPEKLEVKDNWLNNIRKSAVVKSFTFLPKADQENIKKGGISIILIKPVMIDNVFYGFLGYYFTKRKPFDIELRNFLNIVTETVSIVLKRHHNLEHIRIMEEEKKIHENMLLRSEQMAALGQLSSAITHEIRQPLQSIKVLTESVIFWDKENKKMKYEDMLENFRKISSRVDRIDKIIQNMRLMAQSPEKIEIKTVDLNRIVSDTIELFGQKIKNNGIDLKLSLDPSLPEFLFSDIQLQQFLINLVTNSINALNTIEKADKFIRIKTSNAKDHIMLTVADNGPGIPDNIKDRIFTPFFTTNTRSEGTGMGLYIVKNILKFYNSEIDVSNDAKGGAVFTVKLNIKR